MSAPTADIQTAGSDARDFTVERQRVELDIDFKTRSLRGRTEITIVPLTTDLKRIKLHARQCNITAAFVQGIPARYQHYDIHRRINPHPSFKIRQYHLHRAKLEPALSNPPAQELSVIIPPKVRITEDKQGKDPIQDVPLAKLSRGDLSAIPETPNVELGTSFEPLTIVIIYQISHIRDGLQFVGFNETDKRYPHIYSRNSLFPGTASALFPCVDDLQSRNGWEISIKVPRTLGDAFRPDTPRGDNLLGLTDQEEALELVVVGSGETTDEILNPGDSTSKTTVFTVSSPVSANQIGFAVGPFETVDLSDFREVDEDDKLGSNATQVRGFCLPGRVEEMRNTAMPLAKAVDFFTTSFTTYPFESLHLCFLDDMKDDTAVTAGLLFCSSRLLFPPDVIDTLIPVTRHLVLGLASQFSGICMAAKESADTWVTSGVASFMADLFLKQLTGNNEYRWAQKMASERVCELDVERPSLHSLGTILDLDPSELAFLSLKAGVILFILDRRLAKTGGSAGMTRIISRLLTNAKTGDAEGTLVSTSQFQRQCEKMGHIRLDSFFNQWVYGAGCPIFEIRQSFNKKKLVVHLTIEQKQSRQQTSNTELDPKNFVRDLREETNEVWAGQIQPVFTGPMTIRIHEADGTPYEHIVEIKDIVTILEIPYNTKYKRLKRSKRQKERNAGGAAGPANSDAQDDVLLYCLGDVLQSKEEFEDWRLADWPEDIEHAMGEESYEWVRIDADFEWICKMTINLPSYMFVSQLQQDRDVVAQYESLRFMASQPGNGLMATFLIRTLMDRRYFHGIRTLAASLLPKTAKSELNWIGLFHLEKAFSEMFCVAGSPMTRPNDFSDRASYLMQCAIPQAIATIKDNSGHAPIRVKRFFTDKLKFNDNSDNEFSDAYYISTLLQGLAETLTPSGNLGYYRNLTVDEEEDEYRFRQDAINELERHRRIDEWIASYHNTLSLTALDCMSRLAKVDVMRPKLTDFIQYTREGNAEQLRAKAFGCLIDQGMLRQPSIMRYTINVLSTASSPYIRSQVFQAFGRGLGQIAIGIKFSDKRLEAADGLVIEQEGSTEERASDIARRTTITGALKSLKEELAGDEVLQDALWGAMSSPTISLYELPNLLDLCELLYEPEDRFVLALRYPRYWRVQHLGKGKLRFSQTAHVRTSPMQPLKVPKPLATESASVPPAPRPGAKISLSSSNLQRRQSTINLTSSAQSTAKAKPVSKSRISRSPDIITKPHDRPSRIVVLRISSSRLAEVFNRPAAAPALDGPWEGPPAYQNEARDGQRTSNGTTTEPGENGHVGDRPLETPSNKMSKKRKSETPQPPGVEQPFKKRRSQTPKSATPAEEPPYNSYVPQTSAMPAPDAVSKPTTSAEPKKPSLKIRLSFGPGAGKSSSPPNK